MRRDPKPADAWWDPKENEWVHGAKDAEGRLIGEVRYWNPDGVLISTADHVAGKPHGSARRYYRNGEVSQDSTYVDGLIDGVRRYVRPVDPDVVDGYLERCDDSIETYHCIYERGDLIGMLYFDRDGRELDEHGRAMKQRPANIPPTSYHSQGLWRWTRRRGEAGSERIEAREWFESGALREESDYVTGTEREYYENGQLRTDGQRKAVGAGYPMAGTWRTYDNRGQLRCVAERGDGPFEIHRIWHRTPSEAAGGGVVREGAVFQKLEIGNWIVRDEAGAAIAEWDLGPAIDDQAVIDHAVAADTLDDAYQPPAGDRSVIAVLARARRAGSTRDPSVLGLDSTPAWKCPDEQGELVPIADEPRRGVVGLLAAMRWGPPDGELLAELAALMFRADRAAAALDLIDAAQLLGDTPAWQTAKGSYLRALGRAGEADTILAGPDRLDARAIELLEEIRANPDDDAPRLVLADHLANAFPAHAALIVAQCSGHRDAHAAFLATLPDWLREDYGPPVRGFFERLLYFEAEQFVSCDLDLLFRIAPTCTTVDLTDASHHIATLVTLPGMRRYRELSFSDTYLQELQVEQLASCPHFENLEYLGLHGTGLGDEDLRTLARATGLPRLSSLNLTYGREDMDYRIAGMQALADAPFARQLEALSIGGRWLGDEVVEVIARFPALVALDLSRNSLTDAGAVALARLPNNFASLRLASNDFTDRGRDALVERFGEGVVSFD